MRILFVEDEPSIAEAVASLLKKQHYSVDLAYDGETGLDYAASGVYALLVLDIMLPKIDGITLLKTLRKQNIRTPIIMLTAKSEVDDKVLGLDAGADDYLTKPFQMKELLARIRSLSRRKDLDYQEDQLAFGNVVLARNELQLATTTNQVVLSPKEMKLMELFLSRPKVILSKETIINKIWGFDPDVEENRVEIYVSLLRKKLTLLEADIGIRTIRNAGYILQSKEPPC
ncbi:response regulator transcription factor [Enterococcus casseliflavus]|uniref:response regulator transcription factor n=1 Tax=Enterococcus casseliflavus TaxID=37734 RepID=UPI00201CFEF8|nr:response regulator transcription factor [Enterococcus casseliflavus]MDT2990848.1 response regulator transcription factor [Enterococcus casseliflavus]MDV7689929.1 response regulator transcription factor [Enterococcus casseliflavus]MDV7713017.1 response regulator transcription factor [Enterococcus casseliflavus]MDV7737648.1 response regulator transcription factor [Enterococcus casseliflavus]UQZ98555.1 response regulator transcription factor [Enterococcus casseliflavus]